VHRVKISLKFGIGQPQVTGNVHATRLKLVHVYLSQVQIPNMSFYTALLQETVVSKMNFSLVHGN